jgi:hypothetical protein
MLNGGFIRLRWTRWRQTSFPDGMLIAKLGSRYHITILEIGDDAANQVQELWSWFAPFTLNAHWDYWTMTIQGWAWVSTKHKCGHTKFVGPVSWWTALTRCRHGGGTNGGKKVHVKGSSCVVSVRLVFWTVRHTSVTLDSNAKGMSKYSLVNKTIILNTHRCAGSCTTVCTTFPERLSILSYLVCLYPLDSAMLCLPFYSPVTTF